MRKILTRVSAIVIAFVMILLAIPAVETKADEATITIHFKNTEGWSSVSVYTWDPEAYGSWPGTDITSTKDGDYYTATLTEHEGTTLNIIFNDGGAGSQTADLSIDLSKGSEWWCVPNGFDGKVTCAIVATKEEAEAVKTETDEPAKDTETTGAEKPDVETPATEKPGTQEKPAADTPMSDGMIVLIAAIITVVVVLGGFAVYLFIKKKKA